MPHITDNKATNTAKMNIEEVILTVSELPTDTKVKAWIFQLEKKHYHVATYSIFRGPIVTAIWESDKRGRRKVPTPIFSRNTPDHLQCVREYLQTIENNV